MNITEIEFKLRDVVSQLCKDFSFSIPCHLKINISNRLRCSNGTCQILLSTFAEVKSVKIIMSRALLDEFGWEKFEETFRHEMAHLASNIIYGKKGHCEAFKKLCRAFGGKMNRKMAGIRYADCADTNYVKTIKKWKYSCGGCSVIKQMANRMKKSKRGNPNYSCMRCGCTLDKWIETRLA